MEVLGFFLALMLLGGFLSTLAPIIIEGLACLFCFLCLCLCETLKLIGKGAAWLIVLSAKGLYWTSIQAGLFLFILFDEWRRGPREEETGEGFFGREQPKAQPYQDPFAAALEQLGLAEPFSPADLKKAYREAMKVAHTDAGGTKEAAQALNIARDLVMQVKGWK